MDYSQIAVVFLTLADHKPSKALPKWREKSRSPGSQQDHSAASPAWIFAL
jgi:hypothetical protein